MRNFKAIGGILVAATLALAGCSAGATSSEPTGEPDPEATLRIGVSVLQSSWDVARTVGSLEVPLLKLVYDGLTNLDVDNQVAPGLAESWSTPDSGKTWEFQLREGVTFSSGDTFDASDAQATLERYRTLEGSTLRGMLGGVESIEAVSPTVLRVVQKAPDVTLPAILSDRPGIMMSEDELSGPITEPVGTGPFVFESEEPGVAFQAAANPDYWQDDYVQVAGLDVQRIEDAVARSNALRAGDIDMAIVPAQQLAEVQSAGDVLTYNIKGRELGGITFNPNLLPQLEDQRVRDALNMAIDREGISIGSLLKQGEPATQVRVAGAPGYSDAAENFSYDPEKAKELLEEAGFGDGFTVEATTAPKTQKIAEAVQGYWDEIGVTLKLVTTPAQANADVLWYNPVYPVGFWSFDGAADPSLAYQRLMTPTGAYNPGKIEDPAVSALVAESVAADDETARQEAFDELAGAMSEKTLGNTVVVFSYQSVAYSDRLTGVQDWQSGFPIVQGVGVSK